MMALRRVYYMDVGNGSTKSLARACLPATTTYHYRFNVCSHAFCAVTAASVLPGALTPHKSASKFRIGSGRAGGQRQPA
jgi:hypothetical protein